MAEKADSEEETGTLYGKPFSLSEVATLSEIDRANVTVTLPGGGVLRPWRFASSAEEALSCIVSTLEE